jgi:Ca-activated chloride channel family protein
MTDGFFLRWKLGQPYVLEGKSESVHTLLTIEPNPEVLGQAGADTVLPVHLVVLVDVSSSMDYLVRADPAARVLGEVETEGRPSRAVESLVPTRREVACQVTGRLAERLGPADRMTLIAFDDQAHVLAAYLPGGAAELLQDAVGRLRDVGGGGTCLGRGLQAVRKYLGSATPLETRKLIVLSDGEDQEPELALAEAQRVGQDHHVPVVALGTGECKVAFLTELAKCTLGGSFNHIRDESDAEQLFHRILTGQKNVQATGVVVRLWLSPEVYVGELYRTRPEVLYVGDLEPSPDNVVELWLEQMERGKAYEFLFRATVPGRPAGQRLRIARASLEYDLPALGRLREKIETNIFVEYTADAQQARQRSGDVRRVLTRAEVQRQVLFLQGKIDSVRRGDASDKDRAVVANLLKALVQKFEEFGDLPMANQYRLMQEEFLGRGSISQEMLNRSLAASSIAEEVVVAQDIDF